MGIPSGPAPKSTVAALTASAAAGLFANRPARIATGAAAGKGTASIGAITRFDDCWAAVTFSRLGEEMGVAVAEGMGEPMISEV